MALSAVKTLLRTDEKRTEKRRNGQKREEDLSRNGPFLR